MLRRWLAVVPLLTLALLLLAGCEEQTATTSGPQPTATAERRSSSAATRAPSRPTAATESDVAGTFVVPRDWRGGTIRFADLPKEAQATIALIARGGPFPYRQDGQTFQNRERILPAHPSGYYREYTAETPGSADRGARRIVAGEAGELYYTDDHYDSFRLVVE